jgi:hypothetical protein
MEKWRKFANGEKDQPGAIENKILARKIMGHRQTQQFKLTDNEIPLREP